MFRLGKFSASLNSLIIKKALVNKFGPTGLNGKIVLSESNLRLPGVAILSYKIASIASQHDIFYLAFGI